MIIFFHSKQFSSDGDFQKFKDTVIGLYDVDADGKISMSEVRKLFLHILGESKKFKRLQASGLLPILQICYKNCYHFSGILSIQIRKFSWYESVVLFPIYARFYNIVQSQTPLYLVAILVVLLFLSLFCGWLA